MQSNSAVRTNELILSDEFNLFQELYSRCDTPEQKAHALTVFIDGILPAISGQFVESNEDDKVIQLIPQVAKLRELINSLDFSDAQKLFIGSQLSILEGYFAQELELPELNEDDEKDVVVEDTARIGIIASSLRDLVAEVLSAPSEQIESATVNMRQKMALVLQDQLFKAGPDLSTAAAKITKSANDIQSPDTLYLIRNLTSVLSFAIDKLNTLPNGIDITDYLALNQLSPIKFTQLIQNLIDRLEAVFEGGLINPAKIKPNFFPAMAGLLTEKVEEGVGIDHINTNIVTDYQNQLRSHFPEPSSAPVYYDLAVFRSEQQSILEALSATRVSLESPNQEDLMMSLTNLLSAIKAFATKYATPVSSYAVNQESPNGTFLYKDPNSNSFLVANLKAIANSTT